MGRDQKNKDVDEWFAKLNHPLKAVMMQTRDMILAADPRMSESIKWSTPTFDYKGNLLSIQPRAKQFVSLLVHQGAEIPGTHPRLLGDSRLARTMRFTDKDDLDAQRGDLETLVRSWCDWRDSVQA
jgi:hypothetical protein